ncbi:MAG: HAMP domain-containing protein [Pseudazoarcus pumilus]|nr:HAMP domain-containing protein [Pseudazoarcus pumilus]
MKRAGIALILALAAVSLFLLTSVSANLDLLGGLFPQLLAINGVAAVILASVVLVQLVRLWREYRVRSFGSRIKYRLMLMFALMAVIPGLILYAVSLFFVVRSIDSWFDVRVERALDGGIVLGQTALDHLVNQVVERGRDVAIELDGNIAASSIRLNALRERSGVATLTLLGPGGQLVTTVSSGVGSLLPDLPNSTQLRQARQLRRYAQVEARDDESMMIRVVVPIQDRSMLGEPHYLQLTEPVPPALMRNVEAVQEAHREYQQIVIGRDGLSQIYLLTLTLTLFLALLGAIAVAFVLTRRLVAPLLILAEGTRAVAQGDFSPRRALPARDELGVLTQSFNQMTRQLEEARAQTDKSRHAVETARVYLESVLANLSAGVLAFGEDGRLRASNHGAVDILGDALEGFEDIPLSHWPRLHGFRDALFDGFARNQAEWHEQVEVVRDGNEPQTLRIHGARLPASSGGGMVVVFDDISELVRAQRTAAWGEVARRLAHEIKNPLTPIQLSAERLAYKLESRLDEDGQAILQRATRTIVNQVEAMKNLVNAFRDYARPQSPSHVPVDLHALVAEVLGLYESSPLKVRCEFVPGAPQAGGDPAQIRQIIHNLFQNSEDALSGTENAQVTVTTRVVGDRVELNWRDNGPGFPPEVLSRPFEPYFTTKARGTGLGLAIMKKIVDEHGGDVQLSNGAGGGAVVTVKFPLAGESIPERNAETW